MGGVRVVKVSKSFGGVRVLDGVSLEAGPSEVHVVLGPNGVGKTTLLRIIAGVLRPDSGEVVVDGVVGLVPQGDSLLPWKRVEDNIALPLLLAGVPKAKALEEARAVAARLGISQYLRSYPRELSGGTRRKVAIARALVMRPSVLLLDEPYAGLDAASVRSLNEVIASLAREGVTVVMSTHQVLEASPVATSVTALAGRPARVALQLRGDGPLGERLVEAAAGLWGGAVGA